MIPGLKSAIIVMETKARGCESFSQDGNDFYVFGLLSAWEEDKKARRKIN